MATVLRLPRALNYHSLAVCQLCILRAKLTIMPNTAFVRSAFLMFLAQLLRFAIAKRYFLVFWLIWDYCALLFYMSSKSSPSSGNHLKRGRKDDDGCITQG